MPRLRPAGPLAAGYRRATISDLTGNANLAQNQPLIAGHSYNMTLQINVPNTSTSTKTLRRSA